MNNKLKKIRLGNDIGIVWRIGSDNGGAAITAATKVTVYVETASGKERVYPPFSISPDGVITLQFLASDQRLAAVYRIGCKYLVRDESVIGGFATYSLDKPDAFELVTTSSIASRGTTVELDSTMEFALRGESAYGVWLRNGHTGTEDDFLAWVCAPATQAASVLNELIENIMRTNNEALNLSKEALSALDTAHKALNTLVGEVDELKKTLVDTNTNALDVIKRMENQINLSNEALSEMLSNSEIRLDEKLKDSEQRLSKMLSDSAKSLVQYLNQTTGQLNEFIESWDLHLTQKSTDFDTMTKAANDKVASLTSLEENINQVEEERVNSEGTRTSNESKREENERLRVQNDNDRAKKIEKALTDCSSATTGANNSKKAADDAASDALIAAESARNGLSELYDFDCGTV